MTTSTHSIMNRLLERGLFETIENLSDQEAIDLTERYSTHNYHPLPVNIVKGEGARVQDGAGKDYIDCIGSYSAIAHGHLNEEVIQAVVRQIRKITLTSRAMYNSEL
ncbi:MAG: aminotransferase class III-fold pyridoxal phosphate-dependent enzyme, partial [Chthonomonas sp.]|nr:aminotransferase class III-fold pyridoxal phosphate-dependent enzyme [Chthonomonas sp.]